MRRFLFYITVVFIFTILIFNYNIYGNLSLKNNIGHFYKDALNKQTLVYKSDYIYNHKNSMCEASGKNDKSICKYILEMDTSKIDVLLLAIKLDESKINSNQIEIYTYNNEGISFYKVDNFYINKSTDKWLVLTKKQVDKVIIYAEAEVSESGSYGDVLNIEEVRINDGKDLENLRCSFFRTFIGSFISAIVILMCLLVLFKSKIDKKVFNKKIKLETIFLILGLFVGIIFSFLFPLYQTPDELLHINMIYEDLGINSDFLEMTDYYGDTIRIPYNYNEKVNYDKYFDLSKKISVEEYGKNLNIRIIAHLPQAIGLVLGSFFEFPVLVVITISEILAVLFYVVVCYFALRLMPIKKEVMMMFCLMPICIQQMGSFSYDVVLNSVSFLYIAYVLYLKFKKEKITLLDLIKLFLMLIIISVVKLPYIILGGLVILLPISKLDIDLKFFKVNASMLGENRKKVVGVVGVILVLILILILKFFNTNVYGRILCAALITSSATVKLLFNTIVEYYSTYLIQLTGSFGWFDVPVSIAFIVFVLFSVVLFCFLDVNEKNKDKCLFKKWEVIYLYFLGIGFCFIIILSMFHWTLQLENIYNYNNLSILEYAKLIRDIKVIEGVQGRYFIPIIPLFVLPLSSKVISKVILKINYKFYLFIYYLVIVIYMISVLLNRYWII